MLTAQLCSHFYLIMNYLTSLIILKCYFEVNGLAVAGCLQII